MTLTIITEIILITALLDVSSDQEVFIEKTVQQSISSSQYKSVQQGNKYG